MRNVNFICLSCLLIFSCVTLNIESDSQESYSYDDEKLAIVNDTLYLKILKAEKNGFWVPTKKEIEQIDTIYQDAIKNNEFDFLAEPTISKIKSYYRQHLCYVNNDNEKMIYIFALCNIPELLSNDNVLELVEWESHIISVQDGGPCYWKMKINLTQNKYINFSVNGN